MPQDKMLSRIEAKIDLLLKKQGMSEKEVSEAVVKSLESIAAPRPAPKLSAAEQQAIDNAPKTPTGANGPVGTGPRVDAATPAAAASTVSAAASVRAGAGGDGSVAGSGERAPSTAASVPPADKGKGK